MDTKRLSFFAGSFSIALLLVATSAFAITQDFNGLPKGTIVTNQIPLMTISCDNSRPSGPDACIIFDSSNPGAGCEDLGTPNQDFGGPGIGNGGEAGQPGENSVALGNLLIVAENLIDVSPADGLVDDPDDEAQGGVITFDFDVAVDVTKIVIVDIDNDETCVISLTDVNGVVTQIPAAALGNNSVQTVQLGGAMIQRMEVDFSSSGAIAEFTFDSVVPTEESTWGAIKALYE